MMIVQVAGLTGKKEFIGWWDVYQVVDGVQKLLNGLGAVLEIAFLAAAIKHVSGNSDSVSQSDQLTVTDANADGVLKVGRADRFRDGDKQGSNDVHFSFDFHNFTKHVLQSPSESSTAGE